MKKNQAFTLIEMSIVLIIIGLLVAGTMGGISLIKTSRLETARSITSRAPIANIEGLVAWYETCAADSFNSSENYNGAPITSWYDISPASLILKKNTLNKNGGVAGNLTYISDGINGVPSLKFTSGGHLTIPEFYQGNLMQRTQFVVIRPFNFGSVIVSGMIISQNKLLFPDGSMTAAISPAVATGQNYIIAMYYNNNASKVYLNNTANMVGNTEVNATTTSQDGLTVGADTNNSKPYVGLISEIIIYNRPLKATERKDVFKYLSTKYKISVQGI